MKKAISVILSIVMIVLSFSISVYSEDAVNADFTRYYGEVNNIKNITVSDARNVLLQSIGAIDNADFPYADADSDGAVTAIDARAILRVAVKLDSSDNYFFTNKANLFNTLINSIKPAKYKYFSQTKDYVDDVTYDNAKLIESIDNQLNNLMSKFDGEAEALDLSKEIVAEKGKVTYTGTKYDKYFTISNTNYPLSGNELTSLLKPENIESFELKTNENYKFNAKDKNTGKDAWISNELTGLNSITVHIKSDNVTGLTEDYSSLNTSKAFDILSKDDIEAAIGSTGSLSGLDGIDGLEDLGARMNINMSFNNINYNNSYVKIYYNPSTGIPVATEHSLHYDMTVTMSLDLYVPNIGGMITGWEIGKPYLKAKGDINIINSNTKTQSFCFHNADPAYPITLTPANS